MSHHPPHFRETVATLRARAFPAGDLLTTQLAESPASTLSDNGSAGLSPHDRSLYLEATTLRTKEV